MSIQTVILAAGMGTRLGRPHPKPLTELRDGRTILAQQLGNLRSVYGREAEVLIVVGFKLEMILEAAPNVAFTYNEVYDQTNTSKSLLRALRVTGDRGVLWLNGDVVFHPDVLRRVQPLIDESKSFVCVNTSSVGDEEVKYTVDDEGFIKELSKKVGAGALGEAVGINYIAAQDKAKLLQRLDEVHDQEYFEGGLELAIAHDGVKVTPVDISDLYAVEVDFAEDLERANQEL
ncbi:phosphocholine cytidylyltransferase family protein [Krasilnikoviella flava]|uniref:Choline kinase n=1 Tax=Krasilnikoviella flava TaxID=526729 RepID=A0A1T5I9T5_9MICO|nr:phosphocholine cytidylyltransferase family protein [Krasilnikoviella flava]SKC35964.1 Choline kinase [Krasilnikoviella flava]